MSFDCCQPSCDVPPVSVPGIQGASPCTNVTVTFTVPAIGSPVTVSVIDTSEQIVGTTVAIDGPAHFTVTTVLSANQLTLTFQGQTGDVVVGTTIAAGAKLCPAGQQGSNGSSGISTLISNTSGSTVGSSITANVGAGAIYSKGEYVIIQNQNFGIPFTGYFQIATVFGATLSIICLNNSSGITFLAGQYVIPVGSPGMNGYTTLTAPTPPATWNVPGAVGGQATYSVVNTAWMAIGQTVVIDGPATFAVSTINSTTSVTLTWLGATGDLAAGTRLGNTATVSPAGAPAIISAYSNAFLPAAPAYTLTTSLGSVGLSINVPAGTYLIKCRLRFTFSATYLEYSHSAPATNYILVLPYNSNGAIANSGSTPFIPSTGSSVVPFSYDMGIFYYEIVSTQPLTTLTIQAKINFAPDAGSIQITEGSLIAIPV